MSRLSRLLSVIAVLSALAACSDSPVQRGAITGPNDARSGGPGTGTSMQLAHARVCPSAAPGTVRCHSLVRVDPSGKPVPNPTPRGYVASDLQAAYGLVSASASAGVGQTIAIVDAYDDANAESDLAVYRSTLGLPPCTTANGCFRKVDQNGGTNYPRGDVGWAEEISLDLDMASAICPNCKLLLVEAKTNRLSDLAAAVNTAAALGANVISNSYGGGEFSGEAAFEGNFNHPGIAVVFSSGDAGLGVEFPAASQYVTAVGGTTLRRDATTPRGWTETVWSGAGSGCSAFIQKPSWQADVGCPRRTVADVAAVADPNTGVAVYDTYRLHPGGWLVFGGTSASAPIIGAVYALEGKTASITGASSVYARSASLFDVVSGSNGSCGGAYLCTGTVGYDGPTGNGTPSGTKAF